jgi:hypothetical protein
LARGCVTHAKGWGRAAAWSLHASAGMRHDRRSGIAAQCVLWAAPVGITHDAISRSDPIDRHSIVPRWHTRQAHPLHFPDVAAAAWG